MFMSVGKADGMVEERAVPQTTAPAAPAAVHQTFERQQTLLMIDSSLLAVAVAVALKVPVEVVEGPTVLAARPVEQTNLQLGAHSQLEVSVVETNSAP
jgi:hypothetical protein